MLVRHYKSKKSVDFFIYPTLDTLFGTVSRLYYQFKKNNVKEFALMTLRCHNKPLGILGVSFCGDKSMNARLVGEEIRDHGAAITASLSILDPNK